jgi:hypothetical protein
MQRDHKTAAAALFLLMLFAVPARAHGPTVTLGDDSIDPPSLTLLAYGVVHFRNDSEAVITIVADDESYKSPELPPGEGWHQQYPVPGRYPYHLLNHPDRKGTILVKPR